MPRNGETFKDQSGRAPAISEHGRAPVAETPTGRKKPQRSAAPPSAGGRSNVLAFCVPGNEPNPEGPDNTPHHGPRLLPGGVLDCVRDDMTRRWFDHETSIVTIRRKLNVSIPEAEKIIRKGLRARGYGRKAA